MTCACRRDRDRVEGQYGERYAGRAHYDDGRTSLKARFTGSKPCELSSIAISTYLHCRLQRRLYPTLPIVLLITSPISSTAVIVALSPPGVLSSYPFTEPGYHGGPTSPHQAFEISSYTQSKSCREAANPCLPEQALQVSIAGAAYASCV